jgi:Tol biopolymer transport system component
MRPIFRVAIFLPALACLAACTSQHSYYPAAQPEPDDAQAKQAGPSRPGDSTDVLAAINAGLSNPMPTPSAVRNENDVARRISAINLYGELPTRKPTPPTDGMSNLQQVTFTREGADFDLSIDPTGKHIVFASTRHRPSSDIYMQKITGSTVTQVTTDLAEDRMPTFSPDGQKIAFCSDRSGNWDIYVKSIAGGQPVQITNEPGHEVHPSWSPDSRQLAFCSLSSQSGQWEIVVVDVDNPSNRRFIGTGLFPQFSPDGDKILFQRARYRGTRWFSVWTVDYIDGEGKRPTEIAASTNAAVINPAWSPDGKRIVFSTIINPTVDSRGRPNAADLWMINLDGSGRTRLTSDGYLNAQPLWGADGRIYFVSDRSGADNIWSLTPNKQMLIVGTPDQQDNQATAEAPTP